MDIHNLMNRHYRSEATQIQTKVQCNIMERWSYSRASWNFIETSARINLLPVPPDAIQIGMV